jgi:predicted DNA-binding ribbon-helix-helix protein
VGSLKGPSKDERARVTAAIFWMKTRGKALATLADCRHGLINRNVDVHGRRTSFRFDAATWDALAEVAQREGVSILKLCDEIETAKPDALNLTVAIRS